jgi:hypothetical protein
MDGEGGAADFGAARGVVIAPRSRSQKSSPQRSWLPPTMAIGIAFWSSARPPPPGIRGAA